MTEFEVLLGQVKSGVERFVKFKISSKEDAEDVLQEVYLTAYRKFDQLLNKDSFKPWILSIARNKCNDYFRKRAEILEMPVEDITQLAETMGRQGIENTQDQACQNAVQENLEKLGSKEKEILYLYFWKQMPQTQIAEKLGIPLGTVKSRLYTAKEKFRESYLKEREIAQIRNTMKVPLNENGVRKGNEWKRENGKEGTTFMNRLPEYMPSYTITKIKKDVFPVKWEELMGWFLVPRLGESLSWAMYDQPSGKCSHIYDMQVIGKAKVHGIEGVELTAREASYSGKEEVINRTFVAQLTDTHCRYLATIRNDGDVRNFITFLDGDEFMDCWGFGEDNCGNEVNLSPKGDITREGDIVTSKKKDFLLDIVGRYDVTINGKTYDTVCVMDISTYNNGVVSEQFLDQNGRTILWRRFNRDDWHIERYGNKLWSEQLPDNDRLTVDGQTYVQWYDCITDYIL